MSGICIRPFSLEFLGNYEIKSINMENDNMMHGDLIMKVMIDNKLYDMRVPMTRGRKSGIGLLLREDGTLFMRMMFVNDECEGEVTKRDEYGNIVLRGEVKRGKEVGMWIEYDNDENEIWRGFYRNGKRYSILTKHKGMKGFFKEKNENGELLSVSEYDDEWMKNGKCFEYEEGRMVRECEYKNGVMMRVLREWKGECMIEYDDNGMRVYEGGFEGDMMKGFVREGEGKEYGIDGKSALYVGGWKNGLREGYGSEFKGYSPVYIGEWKNGMRDGKGKELNENEEVVRRGRWIEGVHEDEIKELEDDNGNVKRFEDEYGADLSVFDSDCLNGVERLEIGDDCFTSVDQFVLDGLNELKTIIIGENNFELDKISGEDSKCVIMNCDQLREIHIGDHSFWWYESIELKNLPSLISIQLGDHTFEYCQSILFKSMNDD